MDGDPPGKDFGVTGIFLATITGTVVNFDNIKETADNILEPFTPWVAEKGVGGDGFDQTDATIAVEPKSPQDETSIKFNGAAFITRMRHAGYVAKDFNRSINDDNRTDFTKIELPIVSVYYYQSPFIDQGVPTVYKVVEGQKTYENQALLTWFGKYATATPAQTPDQPK